MTEQLTPYIQGFVIVQCVLFGGFLVASERLKVQTNRILLGLIALLILHMLVNLLSQQLHWLRNFGVAMGFFYGPVFYLYSRCLAFDQFSLSRGSALHLLPGVLAYVVAQWTHLPSYYFAVAIFVSLFVYCCKVAILLKHYRFVLDQNRTELDKHTLSWLQNLLYFQFILLVLNIITIAMFAFGYVQAGNWAEGLLFFGLWTLVSLFIFQGMQQPEMFSGISEEEQSIASQPADNKEYDEKSLQEALRNVDQHLQSTQCYLNHSVTVKELATELEMPPRLLSQAVNQISNMNFSEFINSYRIKHACKLLSERDSSILAVMFDSGFQTKSNFNRAFKKELGLTPVQYKNSQN